VKDYRGRFAPSPTGPLHLGSLVAAVGSFVRAKSKNGIWLVRIEDIDPPREEPGASTQILRALAAHDLTPDQPVLYQHNRLNAYQDALNSLQATGHLYWCNCTRSKIRANLSDPSGPIIYPGTCRNRHLDSEQGRARRLKTNDAVTVFDDKFIGRFEQNLRQEIGDFVLRRADGLFSYQLAVVVDDAFQEITEVVRGQDLIDNTPRQIHLQQLLNYPTPDYIHLPLVLNDDGQKLSKQNHAPALDLNQTRANMSEALKLLGYPEHVLSAAKDTKTLLVNAIRFEKENSILIKTV